jgi:demethylphylloquinol methyltransferase
MDARPDRYRLVGPVYDGLTWLASGPAIHRTREAMLHDLPAGSRALFAGVGHGRDAAFASRRGAHVTVVDTSATMLARCRARLAGRDATILHDDIRALVADDAFDVVVANFFLNVFDLATARAVLAHLVTLTRPGGAVVVGDFAAPSPRGWLQTIQRLHWGFALRTFRLLAGNAVRPLVDVADLLREAGLVDVECRIQRVFGLPLYAAWRARRP